VQAGPVKGSEGPAHVKFVEDPTARLSAQSWVEKKVPRSVLEELRTAHDETEVMQRLFGASTPVGAFKQAMLRVQDWMVHATHLTPGLPKLHQQVAGEPSGKRLDIDLPITRKTTSPFDSESPKTVPEEIDERTTDKTILKRGKDALGAVPDHVAGCIRSAVFPESNYQEMDGDLMRPIADKTDTEVFIPWSEDDERSSTDATDGSDDEIDEHDESKEIVPEDVAGSQICQRSGEGPEITAMKHWQYLRKMKPGDPMMEQWLDHVEDGEKVTRSKILIGNHAAMANSANDKNRARNAHDKSIDEIMDIKEIRQQRIREIGGRLTRRSSVESWTSWSDDSEGDLPQSAMNFDWQRSDIWTENKERRASTSSVGSWPSWSEDVEEIVEQSSVKLNDESVPIASKASTASVDHTARLETNTP
jgi:hypothetical protein